MRSVIIDIDSVGAVLFERSKRARYVNISVRPFRGVRVAVPRGVTFEKAEIIVRRKIDWIRKHLTRMKRLEHERHEGDGEQQITAIDRTEARAKLINRLYELAEKFGFTYNRVFIRNQRTRWGSCSSRQNISLNIKLAVLPDGLADYVILHELVHTRIPNHSKEFWAELDRYTGNAKLLNSRLRKYHTGIL